MTRICVLGNSHVASLKLGWDSLKTQYPNVDITFFANRQRRMEALQVEKGKLVPDNEALKTAIAYTSNGLTSIDSRKFDLYLLYGLDLKPYFPPTTFFSAAVLKESILGSVS
jgi:hypothetical protein